MLQYPNPEERNINSTDSIGKISARLEDLKPIIDKVNELGSAPSGGVQTVTGDLVDNTDPLNPVVNRGYKELIITITKDGDGLDLLQSKDTIVNSVGSISSFTKTGNAYNINIPSSGITGSNSFDVKFGTSTSSVILPIFDSGVLKGYIKVVPNTAAIDVYFYSPLLIADTVINVLDSTSFLINVKVYN